MATSIEWSRYGMNVADQSMDPAQWAANIQEIFSKIHDPTHLLEQPRHYIPVFVLHRFCKTGRDRPWVPPEKDRKQEIARHITAQRKLGPSLPSWRLYGNEDKLADDDTYLVYNTKTKKYDKLHWTECFKTDAPYSKFFEKFTQRDLAMDKWTFRKFEALMKADRQVMENLCVSANILFDALSERETKALDAIVLKRGDVWDMRKYWYLLSTLRNRDRNTHLLGTSEDMEEARAKRKRFMEEKGLGHARDLWLHNVETILNTPHYQVGTSSKIFEFDREDYRTNARERYMVFWEAGPNDEFLLTDNSFGCFEGCRLESKHGMTVGMKPSDVQKRLYTRDFMWHQLFVLSPKLVVALCHGSLIHPNLTKLQRGRYGLRPSILQNLPHPLPHNYYKDLHPDECRFMKQGWEVPEEMEDYFGRKAGSGKHVAGVEGKATNEIQFQITTLSTQQVALVNMILLLNQSSLTGVDNIVYRNPAAIYRAITEYEKQEWGMYTDDKQNSYRAFRKKIFNQFNKGGDVGTSETVSPQASSPNPHSRGMMTPSQEFIPAERQKESQKEKHKSGTTTPAEKKAHFEVDEPAPVKPPLEKKSSGKSESSSTSASLDETPKIITTEHKSVQKPKYDDAMDGIRVSGSSDVKEEPKPIQATPAPKPPTQNQATPSSVHTTPSTKSPETATAPKATDRPTRPQGAPTPRTPEVPQTAPTAPAPLAPSAPPVSPAPSLPLPPQPPHETPAPEAPPATKVSQAPVTSQAPPPQSPPIVKASQGPQGTQAPRAPQAPQAPQAQAPQAPQIPEVRALPPETPTKSEFSLSDSDFFTESEDEEPQKLVVPSPRLVERSSSTRSRKSTDKSERSSRGERRDKTRRERAHSERRERLERPKIGSTKSDDRPRRSRSKGDAERMALVRPQMFEGSRSDRGSGQRGDRERLRREREEFDRLELQREKERLARQKLEVQMELERLERQKLEKERERLERQKLEMERMELERQKREFLREREELQRKEREREMREKEKDMKQAAKMRKEKEAIRQEKEKLAKFEEKRQLEKAREKELREQEQRERERELNERLEKERLQRELETDRERERRLRERQDRDKQKYARHDRPDKSDTSEEWDHRDRKVRRRKSMVHSSPSSEPAVPVRLPPGFEPEITPPSSSHSHPDNCDNGFDPMPTHDLPSPSSAPYSPPLKSPPLKSPPLKSPPMKSPPLKSPTSPSTRRYENALISPTHDAAQKLHLQLNVNNPQLALAPYQHPNPKKEKEHNRRRSEIPKDYNVRRFETPVPLPPLDTAPQRPQQHQRHQSYNQKPMLAITGGDSPAFSTLADNGDFEEDGWEDEDYVQRRDDFAILPSRNNNQHRQERPERAPAKPPVKRLALEAPPVMRRKGSVVRLNTKARAPQSQGSRQEPRRNPYY